jgi:DNA-directed RNA polymerase specialized sigma subunit
LGGLLHLAFLPESERWLIQELFWGRRTAADIAAWMGVSQQAVSTRKQVILDNLLEWMYREVKIPDAEKCRL